MKLKRNDGSVIVDIEFQNIKEALTYCISINADLTGADLSGADLIGANLRYADLIGADLRYADLTGADLSGADLSDANLRGADLTGANLTGAGLRGADLRYADLPFDFKIEPNLKSKIKKSIKYPDNLDMSAWHKCDTIHCLAGWACVLSEQTKQIETQSSTYLAARLTLFGNDEHAQENAEIFFADNDAALAWLNE